MTVFISVETWPAGSLDGSKNDGESGNDEDPDKGRNRVEWPMESKRLVSGGRETSRTQDDGVRPLFCSFPQSGSPTN
jgi:hypothetical protein